MAENQGLRDRWESFRPSKTMLFWSCAGCVALTMLVGFAGAGWVTAGTAQEMTEEAVGEARAELAAAVCMDRFMKAPDAQEKLAVLKQTSSWERDDYLEDGGWVTLAGAEQPIDDAASLCANLLMEAGLAGESTKS
jgi:hypothetical protein